MYQLAWTKKPNYSYDGYVMITTPYPIHVRCCLAYNRKTMLLFRLQFLEEKLQFMINL